MEASRTASSWSARNPPRPLNQLAERAEGGTSQKTTQATNSSSVATSGMVIACSLGLRGERGDRPPSSALELFWAADGVDGSLCGLRPAFASLLICASCSSLTSAFYKCCDQMGLTVNAELSSHKVRPVTWLLATGSQVLAHEQHLHHYKVLLQLTACPS